MWDDLSCVCVCVCVRVCLWLWWFWGSCLFRLSVYVSGSGPRSQRYNSAARLLKIFQILPKPNSPLTSAAQMSNNKTGNSSCLIIRKRRVATWSGIYLRSYPVYHPLLKKVLSRGRKDPEMITNQWLLHEWHHGCRPGCWVALEILGRVAVACCPGILASSSKRKMERQQRDAWV